MALSYISSATAATTSVTLPSFQAGDLIIMYAFNNLSTTLPTLPAGWTNISSSSGTAVGQRAGWKLAVAGATSGTWTSATGLICQVYRGQATNKVPIGVTNTSSTVTSTLSYNLLAAMKGTGGSSWIVGFCGTVSATNAASAPANMTNKTDGSSIAGHDTNGGAVAWPITTVTVNATSSGLTLVIEILAELLALNNYETFKVGDGMSTTEKIR